MIHAQRKGKVGEQELARLIVANMAAVEARVAAMVREPLSEHVKRCSSTQADRGGPDIVGIPRFAIEVKRNQQLLLDKWWLQCVNEARNGDMPVLFYRRNRERWRVRWIMCSCKPHQWLVGDTAMSHWLEWFDVWYETYLTDITFDW